MAAAYLASAADVFSAYMESELSSTGSKTCKARFVPKNQYQDCHLPEKSQLLGPYFFTLFGNGLKCLKQSVIV
jgi:hypothetical protein